MFLQNKYKFKILSCILFYGISFVGFAQKSNQLENEFISDTSRINNFIRLADDISGTNSDSALSLLKVAEIESKKTSNEKALMQIYFKQASILFRKGDNNSALTLYRKSLLSAEKLNDGYYINASKVYIGTIYLLRADYNLALKYNIEGLAYFEKENDFSSVSGIYLNLTFIQTEQGDNDKALEYTKLSYKYSLKSGSKIYESKSLLNFGEIYFNKRKYNKAKVYYIQSLKIAEAHNFYLFIPTIQLNLGAVYSEMNMTDSAAVCYNYVINNEVSPYIKALAYLSFSDLYKNKEDFNKAIEYTEKALTLSKVEKLSETQRKSNNYLANLYALKGNYKKAYEYKLVSEKLNDSIFSKEKYEIQNELETIYEMSKKEEKINQLSREKEIIALKTDRFQYSILFLSVILIVSIIVSLMVLRQNKLKAKHEAVELEQKLLRTQMNPHFIFNSLSSIQDFILSNNPLEASSYLSDFAKLMRSILVNSSENLISLSKEIETVENYLKLQHLRLEDKFDYNISVSDTIDLEEFHVPPMLLQPFIENAIIHGIMKKTDSEGFISVSYNLSDEKLILEVQDNGIGRKLSEKHSDRHHKSKTIDITSQRINLLSNKYKHDIFFEIIDLKDRNHKPSGTLVRFRLPLL